MRFLLLLLLFIPALCLSAPAEINGDTASFSWDHSITPDVTYNVYVDGELINRTMIIGNSFNYIIPIEWHGIIKTVVVTAEDEWGIESLESNAVQFVKKRIPPTAPKQNEVREPVAGVS